MTLIEEVPRLLSPREIRALSPGSVVWGEAMIKEAMDDGSAFVEPPFPAMMGRNQNLWDDEGCCYRPDDGYCTSPEFSGGRSFSVWRWWSSRPSDEERLSVPWPEME